MAGAARQKGRIGFASVSSAALDLTFQYNPTTVQYGRRATYSNNQAAFADFPNAPRSAIPPISWIRNEAEDISMELLFHEDGKRNIEQQLQQLDDFMKPDPNTGKPRDLFFSFGAGRSDRIRVLEKNVNITKWDASLQAQEARVQLKIKCLSSRVRS